MSKPKLLFALFCLLLGTSCTSRSAFKDLDNHLYESYDRAYTLTTDILNCYATSPDDELEVLCEKFRCDGTLDEITSRVYYHRELLQQMIYCCPLEFRRRLMIRIEQHCALEELADIARNPSYFKDLSRFAYEEYED